MALGLAKRFRITVVGAEVMPGYDRVRLSRYVETRDAASLVLRPAEWYEAAGIRLVLGEPVITINREAGEVLTKVGSRIAYDQLVLSTGSSAFVPPLEGVTAEGVFVYRTIGDLEAIMAAAKTAKRALVIGGGLLGLEAAQAVDSLGLPVTIVERAAFPMPRQLNARGGDRVMARIRQLGMEFHGSFAGKAIERRPESLVLIDEEGRELAADLIVISAGIAPNSDLAGQAGLECGVRGGVVVDDSLSTADARIHAIGECALHQGQIYGLAAPAAAMARYVARKLAGKKQKPFPKPDLSTRLKMLGLDVLTVGDPLDRGETFEFESAESYRAITLDGRRVPVGALGVGAWPESAQVHSWYLEGRAVRDKEIERFVAEGELQPGGGSASVTAWPGERVVCNCMSVTKERLCQAMACGATTPATLAEATGASTVCGSCTGLLAELCGDPAEAPVKPAAPLVLVYFGVIAWVLTMTIPVLSPPVATSVDSIVYQLDRFWADSLAKQVTGYSLLGVCLLALAISARKRLPRFRFGSFAKWRVFHAGVGLSSLLLLFVHTGFRFGGDLNTWLMGVFVGLNLLGSAAGIAAGMEVRGGPRSAMLARRMRPGLVVAHYVFFWPLPVLVGFHIAAAYLY